MIVYWSPYVSDKTDMVMSDLDYLQPEAAINFILKPKLNTLHKRDNFSFCPAYKNAFKNVFGLRLSHDYNLTFNSDGVTTDDYDQTFFDASIHIRSVEHKSISFSQQYLFISEKSLEMMVTPSYGEDNVFNKTCMLVPGKFDIGKWIRPVECAFMVKDGYNSISLKRKDIYAYVYFETNEPVEMKRFVLTNDIKNVIHQTMKFRNNKLKMLGKLQHFYEAYEQSKIHKYLIRKIKDNVLI